MLLIPTVANSHFNKWDWFEEHVITASLRLGVGPRMASVDGNRLSVLRVSIQTVNTESFNLSVFMNPTFMDLVLTLQRK